jgi:hypothetical protein
MLRSQRPSDWTQFSGPARTGLTSLFTLCVSSLSKISPHRSCSSRAAVLCAHYCCLPRHTPHLAPSGESRPINDLGRIYTIKFSLTNDNMHVKGKNLRTSNKTRCYPFNCRIINNTCFNGENPVQNLLILKTSQLVLVIFIAEKGSFKFQPIKITKI